jgi:hypothetical protein
MRRSLVLRRPVVSEQATPQRMAPASSGRDAILQRILDEIRWNVAVLRVCEVAYSTGRLHVAADLYGWVEEAYTSILEEVSTLSDAEANALEPAVTGLEGVSFRLANLVLPLMHNPAGIPVC